MDAINACRWCCKAVAYAASYVSLEAGLVAFIFVGLIPQMTHAGVQVGNRISKSSNILETAFLFWFVFWVVSCLKTRIWFFCMLFFPRKCHFKCISDGSTQVLFLGTVFVGRSSRCLIDAAAQLHHIHQLLPLLAHAQLFVADVQQKSCIFSVNFAFFFSQAVRHTKLNNCGILILLWEWGPECCSGGMISMWGITGWPDCHVIKALGAFHHEGRVQDCQDVWSVVLSPKRWKVSLLSQRASQLAVRLCVCFSTIVNYWWLNG